MGSKSLSILSLLFCMTAFGQQKITIWVGKPYSDPNPYNIKTAKVLWPDDTAYQAFGPVINTSPVLGATATRVTQFCRIGSKHLENGHAAYINYDVATDVASAPVYYDDAPMPDHRDTWGGRMYYGGDGSGDSVIMFGQQTWNNLDGHDWSSLDQYFYKIAVSDFGISSKRSIFTGNPTVQKHFRGEVFGNLSSGDSPGEYYIMLFQWNDPADTFWVDVLHTTDYFNHIEAKNVIVESSQFSEGSVAYLGNGKLFCLLRNDQGGKLAVSYSSDYGDTWTSPVLSNLGYFGIYTKMPYIYKYKGKYNAIYQDRDGGNITISRDNDTASFFNNPTGFNEGEIWYNNYSLTTVGIASLGYPSMECIDTINDVFFVAWAHEYATTKANIWYDRYKLNQSNGLPTAPPVLQSCCITSTGFRLDMADLDAGVVSGGYTLAQLANITHFIVDVATDPSFTTFPVVHWGWTADPSSTVHDMRIPATFLSFTELTPNTTYYVRIKAVNFNGESSYTSTSVTTL